MGVIADLLVKVGADVASFKTGMTEVNTKVDEAGSGFAKLGPLALGVAGGILAVGAGLTAFGLHAIDTATAAGQAAFEMSEKFGLTGQQASAYLSVGSQLGLTNEQVSKSFQFLSKNVSAMQITLEAGGKISKTTGQVYKDLGINLLDSSGHMKSANELMLESADAFKNLQDGPEKASLAMKLFGKSGTDMLPMLNQGRAGIEQMMAAGQKMGAVMSNDQVKAAHDLEMQHKKLDTAMAGVTLQIGTFLMPVMATIMDFVVAKAIPAIQSLGQYFMEHLLPAIKQVWAFFMEALGPMITYIKGHFDSLKPVLIAVGVVIGIMLGAAIIVIGLVVLAIVGLVAGIVWLASQVTSWLPYIGRFFQGLGTDVHNIIEGVKSKFNDLVSFFRGLPSSLASAASGMWDSIWLGFRATVNNLIRMWNSLHFTIGGGDFFGQQIPSHTFYVTQLPYFHQGGIVPGSGNVLGVLQGGERIIPRGAAQSGFGGGEVHNHFHIDSGAYIDCPSLDMLANKLVQRWRYAPGT